MSLPTYAFAPEPQQKRQSRRTLWIVVGAVAITIAVLSIITGIVAYRAIQGLKQNGSIPERYYLNIMSGDYTTASAYLDSNATIAGRPVNQPAFIRLAKAADTQFGIVHGITLSTESDATNVTVTVSRGSRSYDVHLVLKLEGNDWKIISADSI